MDRFNSSESDESDEEADGKEEEQVAGQAEEDSDADDQEENSNPLLRKLAIEAKPTNTQRMNRWFQRGLLGESDAKADEADDDEEEDHASSSRPSARGPASKARGPVKRARSLIQIDAGAASSSDDESRGGSEAEQGDEDMSGEDDGEAATFFKGGKAVKTKSGLKPNTVRGLDGLRTSTKTVQDDVVMEDATKKDAASSKKKPSKKDRVRKPAEPQFDEEGDAVDALKVAEKATRAKLKKTTKNYKAQEKTRTDADKEKSEAFEEVPTIEDDEAQHFSSDDDAIAERLALGKHMLAKKSRNALINDSYNRYSLDVEELSGLPEWFVRDEGQHHTPILPVTKAEVDTYKEQLKAINTRPIKKIAEAKARKQVKTQKRWEKVRTRTTHQHTHIRCYIHRSRSVCLDSRLDHASIMRVWCWRPERVHTSDRPRAASTPHTRIAVIVSISISDNFSCPRPVSCLFPRLRLIHQK
jgi:hypothetical protein